MENVPILESRDAAQNFDFSECIEMTNRMNVRIVAVLVAVVIIVGVSMEVFASEMKSGSTSNTSTSISATTSATIAPITCSTASTGTTNSSVGTIEITSPTPLALQSVFVGDTYNISGFVIPRPANTDYVLIQVHQMCSPLDLEANTVQVGPGGTFQWIAKVGATWTTGYYVITAIDTYGVTGSTTVYVGCNY